jgi:hypothetical protein
MLVMPDGTKRRLQGVVFHKISRLLSYRQIQIVQNTIRSFEIRYVPDSSDAPDAGKLTTLLREELYPDVAVDLVPVERIQRGAGMKIEQFISRIVS